MTRKTEATVEDLERVPENGRAELVDGKIVLLPPTGGLNALARGEILASLHDHSRRTGLGYGLPGKVGYLVNLPHRKSFCPSLSYYVGPLTMSLVEGPPVFAVEVRYPGDYGPVAELALRRKRADYFAAGTKVVWDVDLYGQAIRSYRADDPDRPTVFRKGEIASAEFAVPGWSMPVNDLWP